MRPAPTRAALRKLIQQILKSDPDFEAFVLDNFPAVHGRFSGGMDRVAKMNLLLQHAELDCLLAKLREQWPLEMSLYTDWLRYQPAQGAGKDANSARWAAFGLILVAGGIAVVIGDWRLFAVGHGDTRSIVARPASQESPDAPPSTLPAESPARRQSSGAPVQPLPRYQVMKPMQWGSGEALTAPDCSPEEFARHAANLGDAAVIIPEKRKDPARKEWQTTAFLVDAKTGNAVAVMRYWDTDLRTWASNPSVLTTAAIDVVQAVERVVEDTVQPTRPTATVENIVSPISPDLQPMGLTQQGSVRPTQLPPTHDKPYEIRIEPVQAAPSQPATVRVRIVIVPVEGWHLTSAFPNSVRLNPPADVSVQKANLSRNDFNITDKQGSVDAVFTSIHSGRKLIPGILTFAICTATTCDAHKVQIQIELNIQSDL